MKLTAAVIVNAQNLPDWALGVYPKLIARVLGGFVETEERVCKRLGVTTDGRRCG